MPQDHGWTVDYLGCETPGASTLKGRVIDADGQVVYGATVYITLDGWPYDVPATSNEAGWYEFYLNDGQLAQIDWLHIGGVEQALGGEADAEFLVRPDCFQHVDLRERSDR